MGFRACVWDLDGTLLYTLPTIHHYCNQSLRHFGFHDITLDECRDLCRLSIAEFYHKLLKLGGCPPDRVAALQPAIRDYDCAHTSAISPISPSRMQGCVKRLRS